MVFAQAEHRDIMRYCRPCVPACVAVTGHRSVEKRLYGDVLNTSIWSKLTIGNKFAINQFFKFFMILALDALSHWSLSNPCKFHNNRMKNGFFTEFFQTDMFGLTGLMPIRL